MKIVFFCWAGGYQRQDSQRSASLGGRGQPWQRDAGEEQPGAKKHAGVAPQPRWLGQDQKSGTRLLQRAGFAGGRFMGCMILEELDPAVRSDGRQVHVSFPREVQKPAGTLLWGAWSLQWWRATGVGNGILEMPSLELEWGFSIHPNVMSPREAFLKGLSTTGHLLLSWGKPKAAHAKIWFSFFPSWDCFKIFLKAYCTKPLKIKYNPCANQRKPYHIMQMPKNACSAMHTGRGVMSLVPIRQFL